MGVKNLTHKWLTVLVDDHARLRHICAYHCILLLQHLSNHMLFITNSFKHFFTDKLVRSKAMCPCIVHTSRSGIRAACTSLYFLLLKAVVPKLFRLYQKKIKKIFLEFFAAVFCIAHIAQHSSFKLSKCSMYLTVYTI